MATLIYDFETSGLNPYHDDITEIGCYCLETGETFTCLVQPLSDKLLSDEIEFKTGITNKMLHKQGKKPLQAYEEFFNFLHQVYVTHGALTMIAHNGRGFDDIFLKRTHNYLVGENHMEYDSMMKDMTYIDTLLLARYLYPGRKYYSMKAMCSMMNITNETAHRAMSDVLALVQLWGELMKKYKHKHATTDLQHIRYTLY